MWTLRIMNGPQSGTNFPLKEGDNIVGRQAGLDISIPEKGISKRHCNIRLEKGEIQAIDLGSSNGTFVNGKLIKQQAINPGDKISFHNIIVELQYGVIPMMNYRQRNEGATTNQTDPYEAQDFGTEENAKRQKAPENLKESIEQYIENVVMPAVYRLIELFELKWVLGCFVLAFIFLVTLLSTIPMLQITQSSIEKESQRRALTIARHMVDKNEKLLQKGLTSSLSVSTARREEGVKLAVIVEADSGRVLAPASKLGSYEDTPFVNLAREITRYKNYEYVDTLEGETIGASVPIRVYDPSKQTTIVKAFAVVVYDIGALSIDQGKMISLFVQTLAIALVLGFILFFFMIRLIEKPLNHLNQAIDTSLKEGTNINSPYQFPALNSLITNINSLVARIGSSGMSSGDEDINNQSMDKSFEAQNLVRLFKEPAIAVSSENMILDCNTAFENLTGIISGNIQNQDIEALNDQALILNLQDIMERCKEQTNLIMSNSLEFNGIPMEIDGQAFVGNNGVDYFVFTVKEALQEQGGF